MQVRNVGSNYGYSNQNVQKNNHQQSFGMAVGRSLRKKLLANVAGIQGLGTSRILALQSSIVAMQRAPLVAECPDCVVFLRDGNKVRHVNQGTSIEESILSAGRDARRYTEIVALAPNLSTVQTEARTALDAAITHNVSFIDGLIAGSHTEEQLNALVEQGTKLRSVATSKEERLLQIEEADRELRAFFDGGTLEDDVVKALETVE